MTKFVAGLVLLLFAGCAVPQAPQQAEKPPPPVSTAADFLATQVCQTPPKFVRTGKGWAYSPGCATPQPATPATPITWMLAGNLHHSGDPNVYPTRSIALADPSGSFYDLTLTNWPGGGCPTWATTVNTACQDGSMNIAYVQTLADLGGQTAFAFSTLWGPAWVQYFNGLPCLARPSGAGVRYPIFMPQAGWRIIPAWWPNNATTAQPDCTEDGTGKTAVMVAWRGAVKVPLTIGGVMRTVSIEATTGQTYWFAQPTPYDVETLTALKGIGVTRYMLWCDSSLGNCAAATLGADCPDIKTPQGQDISQPYLPTGTSGKWLPQICMDLDSIVQVPEFTGESFFAPQPGFPGMAPAPSPNNRRAARVS